MLKGLSIRTEIITITDFFILPAERLKPSIVYRLTNELLSNSCDMERDMAKGSRMYVE